MRVSEVDVAVIGAGAAGLAAGERLVGKGRRALVLEARGRTGGRSRTLLGHTGFPLDLGCAWLHSADRNPFVPIARALGFTLDERLPDWTRRAGRQGGDWRREVDALEERLAAWKGEDRPAAAFLPEEPRWHAALNAVSTYVSGAALDRVSALDAARYEDSDVNWRVLEGYGALVAAAGADVPVELSCPVRRVDHSGRTILVETPKGTLRCGALVVTVPASLLAERAIAFDPPLPDKEEAAAGLPLGLADKLFLGIDSAAADLPSDHHVLGATDRAGTGSYQLRPHGRPLIECFFGGEQARLLEREGEAAMFAFALEELAGRFGSGVRRRLSPLAATAWGLDEWSRGAYSHALPGRADARERLAAPVDDRLFFAGEACSRHAFSTAHGARLSGLAAAEAVLASAAR